ncbi:MAG: hypothetical protein HFJ04_09395 [Lachnospiraceae bacterium]|nr:hypothetical protein [Lachnospiraceae bacterium]
MSVIIKSFMGIFFFALVIFIGTGLISYQTDVNRACGYKQDVIQELQNSNFSPSVVNACIQAGADHAYEVTIDIASEDGSCSTYTQGHPAVSTADAITAYVTVVYKSRLPFLGIETSNSLRGFAR